MTLIESRVVAYGAPQTRQFKASASEVGLIRPLEEATTQADANEIFDNRLSAIELEIDGGSY